MCFFVVCCAHAAAQLNPSANTRVEVLSALSIVFSLPIQLSVSVPRVTVTTVYV